MNPAKCPSQAALFCEQPKRDIERINLALCTRRNRRLEGLAQRFAGLSGPGGTPGVLTGGAWQACAQSLRA